MKSQSRAGVGIEIGEDAIPIRETAVTGRHPGMVLLRTDFGTTRIVDMLAGDQLPRIC